MKWQLNSKPVFPSKRHQFKH